MENKNNSQRGEKALVTGASGFIGRELCDLLSRENYQLIVHSHHELKPTDKLRQLTSSIVSCDINDTKKLIESMDNASVVFHLAGTAHVNGIPKVILERSIIGGTKSLLQAIGNSNVSKLIYFSSCHADRADTDYGIAKKRAEELIEEAHRETNLGYSILRPVNVYGRHMKGNLLSMIRLIQKKRLPPLPMLDTSMSLVSVEDVCNIALRAAQCTSVNNKTYIVSDGIDYKINDIEDAIYQAMGREKPNWHSPKAVLLMAAYAAGLLGKLIPAMSKIGPNTYRNLVRGEYFPNDAIRKELNFTPQTTLYDQLPCIIADLKSQ